MSAKTEQFLGLYKTYEGLVRAESEDPKAVEDAMAPPDGDKMRMVRQFRNFLAHTDAPGFLEPTDKMLAFLGAQVKAWSSRRDIAKKHLKSVALSICSEKDTCGEAVIKMASLKTMRLAVVLENQKYALVDIWTVSSMPKKAKLSTVKTLKEKPAFVRPDTLMPEIDSDRVTLCTQDGTPAGKLLGTVIF